MECLIIMSIVHSHWSTLMLRLQMAVLVLRRRVRSVGLLRPALQDSFSDLFVKVHAGPLMAADTATATSPMSTALCPPAGHLAVPCVVLPLTRGAARPAVPRETVVPMAGAHWERYTLW